MRDRVEALGRILFAAAQADGHVEAQEVDSILALLESEWANKGLEGKLPPDLIDGLSTLDVNTVTMSDLARPFRDDSEAARRQLLELVVRVHESDGELDYEEDTFVRELGLALGLAEAQFKDLLLEVFEPTPGHEPKPAPPLATAAAPKPAKANKPPKAKKKPAAKPKKAPKAKKASKPKAKKPAKAKKKTKR